MVSYKNELAEVLAELKAIDKKINNTLTEEEVLFVRQLIQEAKYRTEFYRRIAERVATGTVWTVVVAAGIGFVFIAKTIISKYF